MPTVRPLIASGGRWLCCRCAGGLGIADGAVRDRDAGLAGEPGGVAPVGLHGRPCSRRRLARAACRGGFHMTGTAAAGVSVRSAADGKGVNGAGQDRVPQSPVNESRPPYARFVRPGGAAVAGASYGENGFANSHEAHLFWMNSYLSFSSSCVIFFQSSGPTRVINKSKFSHRSS